MSEIVTLGSVCDILNGYAFQSKKYTSSGVRVIRITNVQDGYIEDLEPVFYPQGEADISKYYLKDGDLLISLTGNVGRVGILESDFLPAALNQRVGCIRVKSSEDVLTRYVYFCLRSEKFLRDCLKFSNGVAQKNLSTEWLKSYELNIEDKEGQNHIVFTLDTIQSLLSHYKQQLELLDTLVKARFVEMFGDPVLNDKGWECNILDNILNVGSSMRVFLSELVESGILFYRGTEISKLSTGMNVTPTLFISVEHYGKLKADNGVPQIGDLLLPSICNEGQIWEVTDGEPFYFKDGRVLWLKNVTNKFNPTFLRFYLKLLFQNRFNEIASGTTFCELKIVNLKRLKVVVPPLSLQNEFADFVQQLEKTKADVQKSLDKTQMLFDSLMQEYFG